MDDFGRHYKNRIKLKIVIRAINVIAAMVLLLCCFTGCSKTDEYVRVVELPEEVLLKDAVVEVEEDDVVIVNGKVLKNVDVSLNVGLLPAEIKRMIPLCEAIIIGQIDTGVSYTWDSPGFVWHCVHLAFVNGGSKEENVTMSGDKIIASDGIVRDYLLAMFGDIDGIPNIPETYSQPDEMGKSRIAFSNDLKYMFNLEDMNIGDVDVKSVVLHPDSTADIEMIMSDYSGDEIAGFRFKIRDNTRDTGRAATFMYEIIGAEPLDKRTAKRLDKLPYLDKHWVRFGANVWKKYSMGEKLEASNPKGNSVEEILMFENYGEETDELDKINSKIESDLIREEVLDELWHEVRSYPHSNDKYVQFLATYESVTKSGESLDMYTYNYDVSNECEVSYKDMLRIENITEDDLKNSITDNLILLNDNSSIDDIQIIGFISNDDKSVDYYSYITIKTPEYKNRIIAKYNSVADSLALYMSEEDIVSEDFVGNDNIRLTHGR